MALSATPEGSPEAYWARDPAALVAELGTSADGLGESEAERRQGRQGRAGRRGEEAARALGLLLKQFTSPLVLILVFGAAVSAGMRDWVDTVIILAIVLGSGLLGFAQEYRASAAVARLRRQLAIRATALRDGRAVRLPVERIVPGDVVLLSAGSLVPADGIVLEAKDFLVAEAALTGETFPVEKSPGIVPEAAPAGRRTNCVFQGTSVRSGTARALCVVTGRATEYGRIAERLREAPPESDFARGMRRFGALLTQVMLAIVVVVLTANLLLGRPISDSLLFAVALAVGLSPELLPAIISITLSAGARAMARRGVIVRRLEAIENLGNMDVLCTDKTGTLTLGIVELEATVDASGRPEAEILALAHLNASFETGIDNPLDAAIVETGRKAGLDTGAWLKVDEIPYDFLRRRLTIVAAAGRSAARHLIVTKGALEPVLACCDRIGLADSRPLDPAAREALLAFFREKGAEGYRVLGLAANHVEPRSRYGREDEAALAFMGFLLFRDPPKPDAADTVRDLRRLGASTKIVTGDNRFVAAHLAREVGLDPAAMLTGAELNMLSDDALRHRAGRTQLFAEIDPQQKERIIRTLKRAGHVVGYMGDGVNDAPALHAADIGISVETAVDVARESADIVLLKPDLGVLRQGIEDGRRTFANTRKYIAITTSANFGNMLSMAAASVVLPFLPLLAKQILLNNFLSDFPSVALSVDRVDPEEIRRPQHWHVRDIGRFMMIFGLVSSVFDLLTFGLLRIVFHADEAVFQTAWFMVSLMTELAVALVLRTRRPVPGSRPGPLLAWSTAAVGALAVAIPYAGAAAATFGFVPLPPVMMATLGAVVLLYLAATEGTKRWYFRPHRHRPPHRPPHRRGPAPDARPVSPHSVDVS